MRSAELDSREKYMRDLFAAEDEALLRIRQALREDGKEGINVGANEGRILQVLLKMTGARRVIEIGTLYGYSTLWMARALPEGGKITTLEAMPDHASRARELLEQTECADRIEIIEGDARASLKNIRGPFDVAFIDADKANYLHYLDWAEENVRPGGLIIGDNTYLFGKVFDANLADDSEPSVTAMRTFNRRLADKSKYASVLVPTSEGMTVAFKI